LAMAWSHHPSFRPRTGVLPVLLSSEGHKAGTPRRLAK
jgi:hypothetical protein